MTFKVKKKCVLLDSEQSDTMYDMDYGQKFILVMICECNFFVCVQIFL